MYLQSLLKRNEEKMISKFFKTQLNNPVKGYWTETVIADLEEFKISENFESIKSKSKKAFKNFVKKKVKEVALEKLLEVKSKHSKMTAIDYTELRIQK